MGIQTVRVRNLVLTPHSDALRAIDGLAEAGHVILGFSLFEQREDNFVEQYWVNLDYKINGHENDPNLVQVCATEAKNYSANISQGSFQSTHRTL